MLSTLRARLRAPDSLILGALLSFTLSGLCAAGAPEDDPGTYIPGPRKFVLFEKGDLGVRWVSHSAGGGDYGVHAHPGPEGLVVSVPAGAGWGKVGIFSPDPLVWLDGTGEEARSTTTFEFEPAATSGFVVALCGDFWGKVPGNDPGPPVISLNWHASGDGGAPHAVIATSLRSGSDSREIQDLPPACPPRVQFRLEPGRVVITAPDWPDQVLRWPVIASGQGFRVWAYTQCREAGSPVEMHLKRIELENSSGSLAPEPRPAPGVLALPRKTWFTSTDHSIWEPLGEAGGDFGAFAHFEDTGLFVDVPEGHNWGITGILSAFPLVPLDDRLRETPFQFRLKFDPGRTFALGVAFTTIKTTRYWDTKTGSAYLIRSPEGPYNLMVDAGPYLNMTRRVPEGWIRDSWDGTLVIRIGWRFMEVSLPGGATVRCQGVAFEPGQSHHVAIVSSVEIQNQPARFLLEGVGAGWETPPGMTEIDRAALVDFDDFDVEAYIDALADL